MDIIRKTKKLHDDLACDDYDKSIWKQIEELRLYLGKTTNNQKCLFTKLVEALEEEDYHSASKYQVEMQEKLETLFELYSLYKRNLL